MTQKQLCRFLVLMLISSVFNYSSLDAQTYTTWDQLVGNHSIPGTQGYLSYYWTDGTTTYFQAGSASPGAILTNTNGSFDFNDLILSGPGNHFLLPLIIPPGVTLQGNYNLLSSPNGTKFFSKNIRAQHFIIAPNNIEQMFLFAMAPTAMTN